MRLILLSTLAFLRATHFACAAEKSLDLDQYSGIHASESDCAEVQLDAPATDSNPGGPLANIPVRDQSALGSCTAHAAAVLIDAYLAKKFPPPSLNGPPKHLTSPLALYAEHQMAVKFAGAFQGDSGADIPSMIKQASQSGSCDLDDAQYDVTNFVRLNSCLQLYDEIVKTGESDDLLSEFYGVTDVKEQKAWLIKNRILCRAEHQFHLPPGTLGAANIAQYLEKRDQTGFWKTLLEQRCVVPATRLEPTTMKLPTMTVLTRLKGAKYGPDANKSVHDIQKAIDIQLTQARQPVGIGYCSGFFQKPLPYFDDGGELLQTIVEEKGKDKLAAARSKCGMHASVVMARKWRKGGDGKFHCMYRIQNSWGSDASSCLNYAKNRWLPTTQKGEPGSSDCEGGKVWIDQDELGNVADVNFFKE